MLKLVRILSIASFAASATAHAYPSAAWDRFLNQHEATGNSLADSFSSAKNQYQIGDEWGKKQVNASDLATATPVFVRAAQATARYGGGTAFYLGKINGKHLMGTNHHVQPSLKCQGSSVFTMLGVQAPCKKVFGHWPEIDFALFEVELTASDEAKLLPVGKNFNFDKPLTQGQLLLTIGHGVAENPSRKLVANQDSDCKVFSADGDYHKMADPDDINPGTYEAWSFANGCDVSHGDSGSAMVDRLTGDVVGIIWTGRIPKSPTAQDSKLLDEMLRSQSPSIWKELSYAVPAPKIREVLSRVVSEDTSLDRDSRDTISALVH